MIENHANVVRICLHPFSLITTKGQKFPAAAACPQLATFVDVFYLKPPEALIE